MTISGKITRWNLHQLSTYDRLQYNRERRAEGAAEAAKMARTAQGFAAIRNNAVTEQGNLFSRIAMQRISKRV